MAAIGRRRLARELVRLINEQPARQKELVMQIAAYLIDHHKAGEAHLLLTDVADELLRTQKLLSADVQTAFGLQANTRDQIVAMLKNQTGATTVELSESVDPEMLGGVKVRAVGYELDASVKRQLVKLAGGIS